MECYKCGHNGGGVEYNIYCCEGFEQEVKEKSIYLCDHCSLQKFHY